MMKQMFSVLCIIYIVNVYYTIYIVNVYYTIMQIQTMRDPFSYKVAVKSCTYNNMIVIANFNCDVFNIRIAFVLYIYLYTFSDL